MADDRTRRHGQDRTRININEDYEVRYWTQVLNVDEATLREKVAQFGPLVKDVREATESLQGAQRRPPQAARPSSRPK